VKSAGNERRNQRNFPMPTVLLLGDGENSAQFVSVSLEHTPLILSEVRKALPQLKKELGKQWPVLWVGIENKKPRLRNPHDPSAIIEAACIVLTVKFFGGVGTELGKMALRAATKHIQNWIAKFSRPALPTRTKSLTRARTRRRASKTKKRV
jgi:hypothetical protein